MAQVSQGLSQKLSGQHINRGWPPPYVQYPSSRSLGDLPRPTPVWAHVLIPSGAQFASPGPLAPPASYSGIVHVVCVLGKKFVG